SKQHHYPGRPLPHPPGASQTGPVRPVLLDLLAPYEAMEPDKQRSPHSLSSFHISKSRVPSVSHRHRLSTNLAS
ncbi:hypothetical protein B0F90DRAFT_1756982, partial [Multifurca ochricompacta]